jgi:hypothetical protein
MSQTDGLVQNLIQDLAALEDRVEDVEAVADQLADLEARVARLEERTDMLRLVEEDQHADAEQRRMALIQDAIRDYQHNNRARVVYDRDAADAALHHPDVDRTTLYTDMRKAARMVPDDVATYVSASASETGAAELRFDFTGVETVDASTLFGGGD